ncbi:MAG: SRPBCC domain-containing protein [Bauldia sp.]
MPDDMMNTAAAVREGSQADRTLIIERVFKAPPERVFKAWTDPKILVAWWGPEGFNTPDAKLDVRVGGAWRSTMVGPKGEAHVCSGVYREIAPPKRLVMTWGWEADGRRGHETVIELTFEQVGAGTRMRLIQSLFENAEQRDSHNMGWSSSFNDLERVLG